LCCVLASTALVALVFAAQLARLLRAERTENARHEDELREAFADQLERLEQRLVAHRNESATVPRPMARRRWHSSHCGARRFRQCCST
jgi:uncharacterized membrane-anchored protein YhcB (DUF1043 family)